VTDELPALERHRAAGELETGGGDTPGFSNRCLTAGERHGVEVREALERGQVAAEQLTAPERPVGAVPGSVEDEGKCGAGLAVLGEARRCVRVMVLDADERPSAGRALAIMAS